MLGSHRRPRTRYVKNYTTFLSFLAENGRCATLVVAFSVWRSSPHAIPSSHTDHSHAVTAMPRPQGRPRTRYVAIVLLFGHFGSETGVARYSSSRFHAVIFTPRRPQLPHGPKSRDGRDAGSTQAAPASICNNCTTIMSFLAKNERCATLVVAFSVWQSPPHAIPSSHTDHSHAVTAMPRPQGRPRTRYVASLHPLFCHFWPKNGRCTTPLL